jgi:hypothetical protein
MQRSRAGVIVKILHPQVLTLLVPSPEGAESAYSAPCFGVAYPGDLGRVTFEGLDPIRRSRGEHLPYPADRYKPGHWVYLLDQSGWVGGGAQSATAMAVCREVAGLPGADCRSSPGRRLRHAAAPAVPGSVRDLDALPGPTPEMLESRTPRSRQPWPSAR